MDTWDRCPLSHVCTPLERSSSTSPTYRADRAVSS
jgi:hypothetical protein